jgi:hypothetical protein
VIYKRYHEFIDTIFLASLAFAMLRPVNKYMFKEFFADSWLHPNFFSTFIDFFREHVL